MSQVVWWNFEEGHMPHAIKWQDAGLDLRFAFLFKYGQALCRLWLSRLTTLVHPWYNRRAEWRSVCIRVVCALLQCLTPGAIPCGDIRVINRPKLTRAVLKRDNSCCLNTQKTVNGKSTRFQHKAHDPSGPLKAWHAWISGTMVIWIPIWIGLTTLCLYFALVRLSKLSATVTDSKHKVSINTSCVWCSLDGVDFYLQDEFLLLLAYCGSVAYMLNMWHQTDH